MSYEIFHIALRNMMLQYICSISKLKYVCLELYFLLYIFTYMLHIPQKASGTKLNSTCSMASAL